MNTKEIATRLVELCRKGDFETAQKELFADHAVSIEPFETPEFQKETKGLEEIIKKNHRFEELTKEMHSMTVSEPLLAGNSFVVTMTMDITMKKDGRMNMSELCLYKVKDGKIISEEFIM